MRNFIVLLLLVFASCQNKNNIEKSGRIEIVPTFCKYRDNGILKKVKCRLFKDGEKAVEIKLTEKNLVPGERNIAVSGLEYGKYHIEYITIYNQRNIVNFELGRPELKTIKLCVDYLDYKSNNNVLSIDELNIGETMKIYFHHRGCFDTQDEVLLSITKTKDKTLAEYKGLKYNLTSNQINILREFEIELRSNHRGASSSIDDYVITNSKADQYYVTVDQSFEWNGFENLIKSLKIKP
ncbi:hypothetical protein [Flavobacterium sp. UBA7663]|uniref:hypothetical protein n=1 Tax=Flavobacterium sp. UBA7663 TaxID=1946557 RepID=UPI0025C38389|nr:hypothetical protein [Flavobacterium sp. UBA7663]